MHNSLFQLRLNQPFYLPVNGTAEKLEIEGAELKSLRGAENTIRQFRTRMDISLYHDLNNFKEIPQFIEILGLGYEFSLRHITIHAEETVLLVY